MPKLTAVRSDARDAGGRFSTGNTMASQLRLLELEPSQAAEWVRPYLERAQRRFVSAKKSGLYARVGQRLDGLLRASILLEMQSEALAAEALKLPQKEARVLLAESREAAKEARTALLKLISLVGVRRSTAGEKDPLAKLAAELSEGGDDDE